MNSIKTIFLFACCFGLWANSASAQLGPFTTWRFDESLANRHNEIVNAFKAGTVESDRAALDRFFDEYYFARWTSPDNLGRVQGFSDDLSRDLSGSIGNAREYLLTKSFATLQKMVADKTVTPTARYNAILAIGQLVQREPPARNDPPLAYAQALPYLVQQYENKQNPGFLRLGALIGIVRHTQMGIADQAMAGTTVPALLVDTIKSGKPDQDQKQDREEKEMIDWYRLRALDGLSALNSVGPDGSYVTMLIEIIENPLESLEIRTRAARIFGEWNFQPATDAGIAINYQRIGTLLLSLFKSVTDAEIQQIDELMKKELAASGGGPVQAQPAFVAAGPVGPDPASLTPEQRLEVTTTLERVKGRLQDVMYAMRGASFSGNRPGNGLVWKLTDEDLVKKINNSVLRLRDLFTKLEEGDQELKARGLGGPGGMGDEMVSGPPSSGRSTKPAAKDEKMPKVNLNMIHDELQVFRTELDKIISGS